MQPLRICMIGPFATDPLGTVTVRMVPIAENLSLNHVVRIFLPPYDNPRYSGKIQKFGKVTIHNVRLSRIPLVKYPLVAFRLVLAAYRMRPSITHVFKPKGYSGMAAMLLIVLHWLRMGPPVVIDTDDLEGNHGYASFFRSRRLYPRLMTDFFDFQEKWLVKNANSLTVASRELVNIVVNYFGVDPKKAFYVPNGAWEGKTEDSLSQSGTDDQNGRSILLYTRFQEFDVERLLDIFKRVKSSVHDARLIVLGRGLFGEETRLLDLAKKDQLLDSISLIGWVERSELQSFFKLGDIAIYPFDDTIINRTKCPGKLVQLLSIGKPVVAEAIGQISEYIVDGETGLLVPSGDNVKFADQIIAMLSDAELRNRLGEAAHKDVFNRFGWKTLSREVEASYENAMYEQSSLGQIRPIEVHLP